MIKSLQFQLFDTFRNLNFRFGDLSKFTSERIQNSKPFVLQFLTKQKAYEGVGQLLQKIFYVNHAALVLCKLSFYK